MRRCFWLGVVSYALAFCVGFVALSCTKKVAKVQPAPIEREVAPAPAGSQPEPAGIIRQVGCLPGNVETV